MKNLVRIQDICSRGRQDPPDVERSETVELGKFVLGAVPYFNSPVGRCAMRLSDGEMNHGDILRLTAFASLILPFDLGIDDNMIGLGREPHPRGK